ncbi:GFA family protein [Thalassovita sp.]|uniref:GFA family protein n=1 Tax=Thalassovita sp. TaxID=1979401 RepID=UPI002B26CE4E|nr:GFA family protein [Thalassovita sp.]
MTLRVWQGGCHCGFICFEVTADIDHVRVCDCSICHQRGALIFRVPEAALVLHSPGLDDLRQYEWGSHTAKDYFCPHCGILPFRRPSAPSPQERQEGGQRFYGWAVNTRCLTGFDPVSVSVVRVHGSEIVVD